MLASGVGPCSLPSIVIVHQPGDAARLRRPEPFATGAALFAPGSESTLTVGGSFEAAAVCSADSGVLGVALPGSEAGDCGAGGAGGRAAPRGGGERGVGVPGPSAPPPAWPDDSR